MKTTNSISQVCLFLVLSFFGTLLCASTTVAQYEPEKGSTERKAITDALRVPVEKKLKQSVVFNIDHLKVQDDWAFLLGAPRKPGGGRLDYSKTSNAAGGSDKTLPNARFLRYYPREVAAPAASTFPDRR